MKRQESVVPLRLERNVADVEEVVGVTEVFAEPLQSSKQKQGLAAAHHLTLNMPSKCPANNPALLPSVAKKTRKSLTLEVSQGHSAAVLGKWADEPLDGGLGGAMQAEWDELESFLWCGFHQFPIDGPELVKLI
ncbi:hypothetical protein E2C01_007576 [Portunus trituberculatus]|uniref:Uncharacterized protein n=1 Tax=Portunus trituberculatus TaxID=210409 RepID=A0A5B7CZD2_PORTR|nr:hypothetical protein [Portunus trituberculatus]